MTALRRCLGAAACAATLLVGLAACNGGDADPSSSPSPSAGEPAGEPEGTTVPVYFVTDSGAGPRLVRELHEVQGDPLTQAARLVAGGQPDDPDYRTLWPSVDIQSVYPTDGLLLVQLAAGAQAPRPDDMTGREARLAVQQLVHTLQGVQQERVPVLVKPMAEPYTLFDLRTDFRFHRASPLETLNLVNITSPTEGETVSGDTLTVTGVASSFEASGPCRLISGEEEIAVVGYQSEGWTGDRLFPFEVELSLADVETGRVTVQCETDDPTGGTEGFGPFIDTKTITID